jgi:hypothetical protein
MVVTGDNYLLGELHIQAEEWNCHTVWELSMLKENISKKRIKTFKTLFFLAYISKYMC